LMACFSLDASSSIAAPTCSLTSEMVHFLATFFSRLLTQSLTSSILAVMSHLSSSTAPLTISAIAEALGTLDYIKFEISANEGGLLMYQSAYRLGSTTACLQWLTSL
jgi:hypothetical protein